MWGERRSIQEKKRSHQELSLSGRQSERGRAKERGVVRKPNEGRGEAFLLLDFLGQLGSKTAASLGQKKGRKIFHSLCSIITQFDCHSQSISCKVLRQWITFCSLCLEQNQVNIVFTWAEPEVDLRNGVTWNTHVQTHGQIWLKEVLEHANKKKKNKSRLYRLHNHMTITKLLFKTAYVCTHENGLQYYCVTAAYPCNSMVMALNRGLNCVTVH